MRKAAIKVASEPLSIILNLKFASTALHNVLLETGNLQKLSNHFNKNECIECKMSEKAISKKRIVKRELNS
jgi:hypothetical protein